MSTGTGATIQETVFYEGGPAKGDLVFNLILGLTLIGIPFAVGAIVRALWLRFRITSRRIEVNGGWLGRDRTQVVYSQIREVRSEPEEARVTLEEGFAAQGVRVTGNVHGEPPFTGTLRHRGWRAAEIRLPQLAEGHDVAVIAPAEVEL